MAATIPAGTYEGQTADVATAAVQNYLVTHAGVSDDVVYAMTKALFEHLDDMVAAHAAAKAIKLENAAQEPAGPAASGCGALLQGSGRNVAEAIHGRSGLGATHPLPLVGRGGEGSRRLTLRLTPLTQAISRQGGAG